MAASITLEAHYTYMMQERSPDTLHKLIFSILLFHCAHKNNSLFTQKSHILFVMNLLMHVAFSVPV